MQVLDITTVYRTKVKVLISDNGHLFSDSIFNRLCYYYLTIEKTLSIIEVILLETSGDNITNIDLLVELRNSLNECTEVEKYFSGYVSFVSH